MQVSRLPADDGDVLAARHRQVHRGRAQLGGARELREAERGNPDAQQAPGAVADGLHGAGHVALREPQAEAAEVAVARPTAMTGGIER